jgi:FkbM family methyltransferase
MSRDSLAASAVDERAAFYDRAREYAPYLVTAAGGALFMVRTEDRHIGRSLFAKQGRGEFMVLSRAVAVIEGLLGPEAVAHRTLVDVGANIGTTTIPALFSHGFESAVAIEPEPENFRLLRMNAVLNGLEHQVRALRLAVSNEVGQRDLVVHPERGGKHWIATDRRKLAGRARENATTILKVETTTIDHLVEAGDIEAERTGMLWIDAEGHEGHILEGASSLLARGTPVVLEWAAETLDRVGDRDKLQHAIGESYTHFAEMHRNTRSPETKFPLRPVERLPAFAERLLDPTSGSNVKTDILALRLERSQSNGIEDLGAIIKRKRRRPTS